MRTTPVGRRPAGLGRALVVLAATLAGLVAAVYSLPAGLVGALGVVGVTAGVTVGTRRVVTLGGLALLCGVLWAGLDGAPAVALLVGVGATVFAWDVGGFAVDLAAQLGREAPTVRVEALHAAGTGAVVAGTAGLGYGVYRTAAGYPVAALLLLLVAGIALLAALDQS